MGKKERGRISGIYVDVKNFYALPMRKKNRGVVVEVCTYLPFIGGLLACKIGVFNVETLKDREKKEVDELGGGGGRGYLL